MRLSSGSPPVLHTDDPIQRQDLGLIESHIIASRGCCYNCAFCTAARSLNPQIKPRYRTHDNLAAEIESIRKFHPETDCIRVLDDLFLRDQASIELAIRLFTENKLCWRSMAHINTFRDLPSRCLNEIKKSGCREFFVGIESGNDETLKHIRKPFTVDIAYKTVSRILDAQIAVKCYFILGFPGETESAIRDTVTLASRLRDYANIIGVQLRISPFQYRPYQGTTLYDEIVKKGQTITQIQNRTDISNTGIVNPFDCISGVYAEYDENTLKNYLTEMVKLNS
jgi:anaerobic magnesium-protoporphyrin IX monomethyl ester cyclase